MAIQLTLGFAGAYRNPVTGSYPLGNGYRMLCPELQRFATPDDFSPFNAGGINPYVYCANDPINHADLNGHSFSSIMGEISKGFQAIFEYTSPVWLLVNKALPNWFGVIPSERFEKGAGALVAMARDGVLAGFGVATAGGSRLIIGGELIAGGLSIVSDAAGAFSDETARAISVYAGLGALGTSLAVGGLSVMKEVSDTLRGSAQAYDVDAALRYNESTRDEIVAVDRMPEEVAQPTLLRRIASSKITHTVASQIPGLVTNLIIGGGAALAFFEPTLPPILHPTAHNSSTQARLLSVMFRNVSTHGADPIMNPG